MVAGRADRRMLDPAIVQTRQWVATDRNLLGWLTLLRCRLLARLLSDLERWSQGNQQRVGRARQLARMVVDLWPIAPVARGLEARKIRNKIPDYKRRIEGASDLIRVRRAYQLSFRDRGERLTRLEQMTTRLSDEDKLDELHIVSHVLWSTHYSN